MYKIKEAPMSEIFTGASHLVKVDRRPDAYESTRIYSDLTSGNPTSFR